LALASKVYFPGCLGVSQANFQRRHAYRAHRISVILRKLTAIHLESDQYFPPKGFVSGQTTGIEFNAEAKKWLDTGCSELAVMRRP